MRRDESCLVFVTFFEQNCSFLVHIRKAGDWTSRLIDKIASPDGHTSTFKKISVDGPFGTSADNIFKYETVVLIGKNIK